MEFNKKHADIVLERIFDNKDKYEQIDLVSGIDKRRIPIHRVVLKATSKYFAGLLQSNDSNEKPTEFVLDSSGEVIKTVVEFCYTGSTDFTEQNVEHCLKIAVAAEIDLLVNKCHDYFSAADIPSDSLANRLHSLFQHDAAERDKHMPEILRSMRLDQLTSEFLRETMEPLFKQYKCIELLNDEFMRRVMFYTPSPGCLSARDDSAAWTDKTPVFCVFGRYVSKGNLGLCDSRFIVERYDGSLGEFTSYFTLPSSERFGSNILYKHKMFMIGGHQYEKAKIFSVAYDLKSGKKRNLLTMKEPRYVHTSILMEKSIYVFGGRNENGYLSSCERYDTETGTWHIIKPMNRKRSEASAAILNGLIYVVGGYEDREKISTLVESYDPKTDEWTVRIQLDGGLLRYPLVAFNGMLYAFVNDREVREYNPVENVWTKIQANCRFVSAVTANGCMFAITEGGCFGLVTINERGRKIGFAKRGEVDIDEFNEILLQKCGFVE